ncbi:MAG: cadherin domain-containing protein [Bacteroidota bacterium]
MSKKLIVILLYFIILGLSISCDEDDPEEINLAPEISNQSFTIDENSPDGTLVGTIQAADPEKRSLSFSITAGNTDNTFSLDAASGALTVNTASSLDFESNMSFTLTVTVTDGENTATATITINITDVSENTAPTIDDQQFSIDENSDENTPVGTVVAVDAEQDSLTFSITAGNTAEAFAIDSLSGELLVNTVAAINFEENPSFSLTIEVSDGESTATATITINITDVSENTAPTIDDQQFFIDENSDESTSVGIVIAADAEQDTLTFRITSGNTAEAFAIDSLSGELSVNTVAAINFEENPSFGLTVEVSDGTLSATSTITIQLNDISPEPFTTKAEIIDALNTSYTNLYSYIEFTYLFDAVYAEVISAPTGDWDNIAAKTVTSQDANVSQLWFGAKDIIFVLNNIIISAEEVLPAGQEQDEIIAQARAIRAYLHFNLLNWFGSFPLDLEITDNNSPQASQSDIISFIEFDLNAAIAALPLSWQVGVNNFTTRTAQAILARVKLFNNDWANVLDLANTIENDDTYALSAGTNNFTADSLEIIWGFDETGEAPFSNTYTRGAYVPLFRLTEAYLMQAEANVMIGSNLNSRTALNTLRQRSGQTAIPNDASGSVLIEAIFDQWESEMGFGSVSFSTLKRYERAEDTLSIQNFQLLLPIPQVVIDSNPNLFQNPGY